MPKTHVPPPEADTLSHLPSSWRPYAELMRIQKPIGTLNVYFPLFFGTLYAACVTVPDVKTNFLLSRIAALSFTALILRSTGCTWDDIVDRDLDRLVERTRSRPMARKAVSVRAACVFTLAQTALSGALLFRLLPSHRLQYMGTLLVLVWVYPFTKRHTDFAQVVLGITMGWGILMGAAVMDVDALASDTNGVEHRAGLAGLCLVYLIFAVIYDVIYAHQDVEDDLKAGINSMAVRLLGHTKQVLWVLASLQVALLVAVGARMGAGKFYYSGAVGGNAATLVLTLLKVDLSNPQDCLWWFQVGCLLIGTSIGAGLSFEYVDRTLEWAI